MNTKLYKFNRRGSGINPDGRFETKSYSPFLEDIESEIPENKNTEIFTEVAKTIITSNDSPDVPAQFTINPYRGCEHGCIYCYARPSHSYMNLSPGIDFETKIFAKKNAAEVLINTFKNKNYTCEPITIGSNTDPYQPIERKLEITRSLLKVFLDWKHPLNIITKSSLILKDKDILQEMSKKNLIRVCITISSLNKELINLMEPRAPAPTKRLEAVQTLSELGIPVIVLSAPMIPFLNDYEMESILEQASMHGAKGAGYVFIRLPYEVKDIFKDWLEKHYPQKAKHIINLIKNCRNGKENDSTFGQRFTGTGNYAELLKKRFLLAQKKYGLDYGLPKINRESFSDPTDLRLF